MPVQLFGHGRRLLVVLALVVAATAVALVVSLNRSHDTGDDMDWRSRHTVPHAAGQLDPGFGAPDVKGYYSSQLVRPGPETWTKVRPSSAYRVLVLADGRDDHTPRDAQVAILVNAVQKWAQEEDRVKLKIRYLGDPQTYTDGIDRAASSDNADLIVIAGNNLVDPVAAISANYAGENPQQFLVLGAEVAEPTNNIAASDWTGSAYLGEGLQESQYYDPASVTAPRAYAALRAGVAAILCGYRSLIVRIPTDRY
jgi:basic membrane lipoprotein Med (substrate-binding protein (PBP1-ABC) superfamily)